MEPPVLALPNETGLFVLDTDASDRSIGAVLSQNQDGEEKVIAYAGRTLSVNERNYCITRKELLAVVYFLKYFKHYLLGREFLVRTDHAALSWLRKTPEPIGQNARWLGFMEEFNFRVQHRSAEGHRNADSLSRHPCLNRPSCTACHPDTCAAVTMDDQNPDAVSSGPVLETLVSRGDGPADQLFGWSKEQLIQAQKDDPDVKFLLNLLETSSNRPQWKDVESQSWKVKSLWHEFERLQIHGGLLCRKWTPIHGLGVTWQVILPRKLHSEFVRLVHSGITGGHLGRFKTQDQVRRRAFWPGWKDDVSLEVKKCVECSRYHRGKAPKQTPLHPFHSGDPMEVISLDITGKHPRSYRGNEFIITIICLFSKFAVAVPVRNHTAPVVARALLDHWISLYGTPMKILSDQGREFESQLFQELCSRLEVQKVRTSPYQPSTNGCIERFHRTLNSMLAKVVSENQRDWDERLPAVMAAYRSSRHESTGFTPNFLVFGRENKAPIDLVLGPVMEDSVYQQPAGTYDEFVEQQIAIYQEAYQIARAQLGHAAERRKVDYDQRVKVADFRVNTWVWYYYPRKRVQRSPKWTKFYDGPYLIVNKIPPCDYVLQRTKRSTPFVTHGNKLKLCLGPTPVSWLLLSPDEPDVAGDVPRASEDPLVQRDESQVDSDAQPGQPGEQKEGSDVAGDSVPPDQRQYTLEPMSKRQRRPPRWLADYHF